MPTTKTTTPTPASVDADLAAAAAEHRRLADKAAAIREAGDTTRTAVELAEYRRHFRDLPEPTRHAAQAATRELDALAAAQLLDLDALVAAFDKRQRLDAECHSVALFLSRLDQLDPLPDNAIGVKQTRTPRVASRFGGVTFSAFLDNLITQRTKTAAARRAGQLQSDVEATVDTAEQVAREQAAQLADGERLTVDTPERIADQWRAAVATITREDVEARERDKETGTTGQSTVNALRREKLAALLAAELEVRAEATGAEAAKPSQR